MRPASALLLAAVLLAPAACGSSVTTGDPDTGSVVVTDTSGSDTGSSPDSSTPDSTADTATDSASDSTVPDSGTDVGKDTGKDTGPPTTCPPSPPSTGDLCAVSGGCKYPDPTCGSIYCSCKGGIFYCDGCITPPPPPPPPPPIDSGVCPPVTPGPAEPCSGGIGPCTYPKGLCSETCYCKSSWICFDDPGCSDGGPPPPPPPPPIDGGCAPCATPGDVCKPGTGCGSVGPSCCWKCECNAAGVYDCTPC